jgi:hypothetical protein
VIREAGEYVVQLGGGVCAASADSVYYSTTLTAPRSVSSWVRARGVRHRGSIGGRLIKASSVEAVAERRNQNRSSPLEAAAIRATLAAAEHGSPSSKDIAGRLEVVTLETEKTLLFETRDRQQSGGWIHKSYVTK